MSGRRTIIPSCILFLLPFLGACGDQEPRTPASVPAPSTTTGERAQAVIQPRPPSGIICVSNRFVRRSFPT